MNKLRKTQKMFQDFLTSKKSIIKKHICSSPTISVDTRLAIYKNAYYIRLEEALAHNFPLLKIYLGDEQFSELAAAYCAQYPSTHRSIRWFGDHLENFLSQDEFYRDFCYLAEMAKLEWALTLVFDTYDKPILKIKDITTLPVDAWANMRLHPHPSLRRLDFFWNVPVICQSLLRDEQPVEIEQMESALPWLLWRQDFMSHFAPLRPHEAWAIDAVLRGVTFGEVGEGLCDWFDESEAGIQAASLLKGWLELELLSAVTF